MRHPTDSSHPSAENPCESCMKPRALCLCGELNPVQSRLHVLILQHPQEPDKEIGSARLAHLMLPNSTLRVGLSWPNLAKALETGAEASLASPPQPSRWAALYLGSGVRAPIKAEPLLPASGPTLLFVDRKGAPLPAAEQARIRSELQGLVVLDGTWSQAKALWWRNAWLLKLRRAILQPTRKSLYGGLRREPRSECLSTIESIAESLQAMGESRENTQSLRDMFQKLLGRYREWRPKSPRSRGRPRPARNRRRLRS